MAHIHDVYDQDNHFVINPITRDITSQSEKISITQYDHNSERFTFEIPKIIEGHDMSLSDKVRVHFINIGSNRSNVSKGVYEVDDIRVSSDDSDMLLFSWLISRAATEYSGKLNFSIRFYCISDDNIVDYSWATSIFTGVKISNGIDNSEAITEDYVDILEQWKSEIAMKIDDINSKIESIKIPEIPTQLPNPQSLTFTGAVNASYDGSSEVNVEIPDISGKMDKNNPTGTGSFSLNRKAGTTIGLRSHAEGYNTEASAEGSHAEGGVTKALGYWSHAEGNATTASGIDSHAEGYYNRALGNESHAEGSVTEASGIGSHAEGGVTKALGHYSHAEGIGTVTSGTNSHAEGSDTKASSACQHVQGKFNIEDSSDVYADIIGNGTSDDDRSNAATVDWSGNAWYAGDVYVGSTSGTNKDEGSKKLATEEYVDNSTASIDIPTTLPNPQSLTFTGAVEGTYDGSSALAVEIPSTPEIPTQLPNPKSLTFTGAVTGTYDGSAPLSVKIPTVDDVLAALPTWEGGSY